MFTSSNPPCPYGGEHKDTKTVQIAPLGYMCLVCYSTVGIVKDPRRAK